MERKITFKNSFIGKRAVVVGAGMGGLSVSRVLADYFDELVILDRDELPNRFGKHLMSANIKPRCAS